MKTKAWVAGSIFMVLALVALYGWVNSGFRSLLFIRRQHNCPLLQSPVNVANVTSVLYPGQFRGGDYKPHGGFRFDGLNNNEVTVSAPLDAKLVRIGSNNQEVGVQYFMEFQTDCGLRFTFGHLLRVAPRFQAEFEQIPPADNDSSKTHTVHPRLDIKAGEVIATAVGFLWEDGSPNTSFDFGVFEQWTKNEISKDPNWSVHEKFGTYDNERGLCWLDLLAAKDAQYLKALPGGDQNSGKTSDYCK